ncbi:MAG: glycosyltransferase family 2 protein [Clostridia bacterium]|nr:glycosyltransferase family 2 protein [Clostridia bacterium]
MKTLIIIPAFNEESCILKTVNDVLEHNKKYATDYDVIVINDGSTDCTEKVLTDNDIPHICLIQNLGIGGAVQTGYKYALMNNYDVAIQFDGDGQHDISYAKDLIDEINNGADMAIGSRFVSNEQSGFKSSAARRVGIKIISLFIKLFTGKRVYDPTSGFRACNKTLIKLFSKSYPTEYPEPVSEVTVLKHKLKISEIPANMYERQGGKSSIHAWKNVYYMINVTLAMLAESLKRY